VGGFSFEKNHEGLLKIFQVVLKRIPQLRLHLVGDGPLRAQIERQVKYSGLEQHVLFHGFVNNPLSYIVAADVLVLPSVIEGLPGVILEAMYCKVPVVAYNVGGIAEILDQRTGYLVKKDDEKAFAAAVVEALENPSQSRIQNANLLVNAEFMNRQIALKFVNSYKSLVSGS
jgi:glycosyltransferase involved in cell wall biosynthesis